MSFSLSSSNISISNGTLHASCRRVDGSYNQSSLNLNEKIGNIDGELKYGYGDFSHSSNNISVSGNTLHASCRAINGLYKNSSLNLDHHVTNINGDLRWV